MGMGLPPKIRDVNQTTQTQSDLGIHLTLPALSRHNPYFKRYPRHIDEAAHHTHSHLALI